jgi:hypothetical protein
MFTLTLALIHPQKAVSLTGAIVAFIHENRIPNQAFLSV